MQTIEAVSADIQNICSTPRNKFIQSLVIVQVH